MTELLTAAQMRALEMAAISSGLATGLDLMERAGQGVVEAILEEWPDFAKGTHRAAVLCGPGNNGGDGFVVARLLQRQGWQIEVFLFGDPAQLPPDARTNYDRVIETIQVRDLTRHNEDQERVISNCDLLVDALFGTGLTRGLTGPEEALWPLYDRQPYKEIRDTGVMRPRLVSVDIPSGICADSGRVLSTSETQEGMYAYADLTVTFHRAKLGHFLLDPQSAYSGGLGCRGRLVVKDIGLPSTDDLLGSEALCSHAHLNDKAPFSLSKGGAHSGQFHKFHYGHALVVSGSMGTTGAARLATRGALRAGAGLVTLAAPPDAMPECAAQVTAIMLRCLDSPAAFADLLDDKRINVICLGPGAGVAQCAALLPIALRSERALVLDADALTTLAQDPDLFGRLHQNCILTPHEGEFARLFPDIAKRLHGPPTKGPAYSKLDAAKEAASRAGCTVLLKGRDTAIASPEGSLSLHVAADDRAAPWLATAGSGDVLAGFITGLLARSAFLPSDPSIEPMHSAKSAVWLHTECARRFGPGLIAEDLPEALPAVLAELGF